MITMHLILLKKENAESSPTWPNIFKCQWHGDSHHRHRTVHLIRRRDSGIWKTNSTDTRNTVLIYWHGNNWFRCKGWGTYCRFQLLVILTKDDVFNEYVLPIQEILKITFNLTGLQMIAGELYHKDNMWDSSFFQQLTSKPAFVRFVNYVQSLKQQYGTIVVVGHNVHFDLRFLYNKLVQECLWLKFELNVDGVVDSLALFRKYYPERSHVVMVAEDILWEVWQNILARTHLWAMMHWKMLGCWNVYQL